MKLNLQKELDELAKKEEIALEKASKTIIDSAVLLLSENASLDRELLKDARLDHLIRKSDEYSSKSIAKKELQKIYGRTYTHNQIKEICIKYRLRFLNVSYYNGNLPSDICSTLKRIRDTYRNGGGELHYDLYIAAPLSSFESVSVYKDPLLFYRVYNKETSESEYSLQSVWGTELNKLRKIAVWPLQGFFNLFIIIAVVLSILIGLMLINVLSFIVAVLLSCILGAFLSGWLTSALNNSTNKLFSEDNWNTNQNLNYK